MYKISKGQNKAYVSSIGANVLSLTLNGEEILKKRYDKYATHGGMSVLIPYPDIITDATYNFEGITYRLPKNATYEGNNKDSMHGLVKDKKWEIIESKNNKIRLSFTLNNKKFYPTTILVTASYLITYKKFSAVYEVNNLGDKNAPLNCGVHPYFIFNDYWKINLKKPVRHISNEYTNTPKIDNELIYYFSKNENKEYDDTYCCSNFFLLEAQNKVIKLITRNMRFFEIYSGKYTEGKSVAIEPMSGVPNNFNSKFALNILKPRETFTCSLSIYLFLKINADKAC